MTPSANLSLILYPHRRPSTGRIPGDRRTVSKNSVLMGRLSPDLSQYVRARWMKFLVERVLRRDPRLRLLLDEDYEGEPFDYSAQVIVSALADRVAPDDLQGESVPTWTRAIRRWVSEDAAPTPNMIRRVLVALGFDWLVGMGRAGYYQHALVMLHTLWATGNRTRLAAQAKAIFDRTDEQGDTLDDRAFLHATATEVQRLEDAAFACGWRDKQGDVAIPTRCTLPRDFPASSELYAAWMLLDAAIISKHGSVEQRLRAARDGVAMHVDAWLARFYPTESRRVRKPRQTVRRKKQ